MAKRFLYISMVAVLLSACNNTTKEEQQHQISVSGAITGANGKYLKIIDMTKDGFTPDSIQINDTGMFSFTIKSNEPKDFVLYIEPESNIRIVPCPDENIIINATYPNVAESYKISGSAESERLAALLKHHYRANYILDTLQNYYMAHQLDKNIKDIVEYVRETSDSIFRLDRQTHIRFIKEQPNSLASYVALSSKLGLRTNIFDIKNDLEYFKMVDTALMNRYDTIAITLMLNKYVKQAQTIELMTKKTTQIQVGDTLPEIKLANPYGDSISVYGLENKYVLINFWGSWCRPSREIHPELRKIFRTYRYKGFTIYSIALERNLDDWKNTIREDRLIWVNHVSELNYMNSEVAKQLGVDAVPFNLLVDENRIVIAKNITTTELNAKLQELTTQK